MSFPHSTSTLPSTSHVRSVNPSPHVPAGRQTPPGVTASSDDSRRFGLLHDASQHDDLLPEACSRAIEALSDYVESLNRSREPNLAQDIALFTRIKQTQAEIENALWTDADAPALWTLREALQRFLPRLARDFAKPEASDPHGMDLMGFLDQEDVRTLCHGLAVCASPSAGVLFDGAAQKFLRPALQQITDRLLERAVQIGFPEEVSANGTTLDILNWVARALKQELIETSDAIRTAFALALPLLKDWIGASRTDAASSSKVPYLSSHQLSKCAVQIDTVLKFSLIELDDDHRQALADCVIALCEARIRTHLTRRPIDSVTIVSIGNLAKDLLEAGILKPAEPKHLEALAGATQMMSCIPRTDLLAGDCRTLSNACNFLRTLDERGVPGMPGFARYLGQWNASCNGFIDSLASQAFARAWPSAQAASNLISFVKCRSKGLQRQAASEDQFRAVRSAAQCLGQHIVALGGASFTTPQAIGGLLSGLAYLLEAQVMADTQALRALMTQVMKHLGSTGKRIRDEQARRTLLPALAGLLRLEAITLDEAQPALARLLGTAASSSGSYTLQDLQRASRALGMEDEAVAVLPQESSAPTSTASTASTASVSPPVQSEATVTPARRPGYTRIVEAPVSSSTTRTPVPSTSRKTNSDWQQAQKTIKPGRAAPILSSAPVLVAAAPEEARSASQGKSAATTSLNATPNTRSAAMQPAAAPDAPSGADASQPDAGKGRAEQAQSSSAGNDGGQKKREGGKAAPKKVNGKVNGNANGKAATPKQQWFALINSAGALQDLKQLAADPAVRDARDGAGKQQRGGLFHALVAGRKDVVAWLMAPETGYRLEQEAGPLLNAVCVAIDLVSEAQLQAIACFIDSLDPTARSELSAMFRERPAFIAGVQKLLERKGLACAMPAQADAASGDGKKNKVGQAPRSGKGNQADRHRTAALTSACGNGHLDVVQQLLEKGERVNQADGNGYTGLYMAADSGHIDIVRELLRAKANVNQVVGDGYSALMVASENGHLEVVRELLEAGAQVDSVNADGLTALMFASRYGDVGVVQELLKFGAQVNLVYANGRTALMHACEKGDVDIMRELLKAKAQVDQANANGHTALMISSSKGDLAIVQELLNAQAQADLLDRFGYTALMYASQNGHHTIVEALLRSGAQVDRVNALGDTALMLASDSGHLAVVQALLNAGAQVSVPTAREDSALTIATRKHHLAIVQALVPHTFQQALQEVREVLPQSNESAPHPASGE